MALAYAVATVSGLAERSDAAPESCCGIFNLIHGNKMGTVLAVLVTETKPKGIKKPPDQRDGNRSPGFSH